MPFDRATFDQASTDVFHLACRQLEKDGRLHNRIHGFDRSGNEVFTALENIPADHPDAKTVVGHLHLTLVPGRFQDHQDLVADRIRETRTVAAYYVAEVWSAKFDPADDRPPSQREDRIESVMVYAIWPAQVYARTLVADIVRDAAGVPTTRPRNRGADDGAPQFVIGWMNDVMPNEFGKYPTLT